jgi:hypothetical protein
MGDRFYGTADLIGWGQGCDWDYRLRLKGNLVVSDGPDKTTTGKRAKDRVYYLENVELTGRRARTHIGIIHDPGHAEPWIIAMSEKPSYLRTLEYADRWGIEPMFSDFKSRGFGIEDTQLRYADRLDKLILVMSLALYVAVSTGQWDAVHHPTPSEKKSRGPAQESRPKQNLLVHPRNPPHRQVDAILSAAATTLECSVKVIDAKGAKLKHPLISRDSKGLGERPGFLQHLCKAVDEGSQPVLGHVGDQVVEHGALAKQGMGTGLDGV